jgi:hypothetical protein
MLMMVRLRLLLVTAVRVRMLYRLVVPVAAAMLFELVKLMLVLGLLMLMLVMLECLLMRVLLLVLLDRLVLLLSVPEVGLLSRPRAERVVRVSSREAARAPHRRSWSGARGRIERGHDVLVSSNCSGPRRRLRLRHGSERLRRSGVGRRRGRRC